MSISLSISSHRIAYLGIALISYGSKTLVMSIQHQSAITLYSKHRQISRTSSLPILHNFTHIAYCYLLSSHINIRSPKRKNYHERETIKVSTDTAMVRTTTAVSHLSQHLSVLVLSQANSNNKTSDV